MAKKEKTKTAKRGVKREPRHDRAAIIMQLFRSFPQRKFALKTLAAQRLDSALLYPLNQGSALILSIIMASVFFKEKITARCIVGVCMAFGALLIINLL
jgi:multidrug transporter EmrE-like cation transporter